MLRLIKETIIGIFSIVAEILRAAFSNLLESNDTDIMSAETRKILSNDKDRQEYIKAVRNLRAHPEKSQTITLSNGEKVVIMY